MSDPLHMDAESLIWAPYAASSHLPANERMQLQQPMLSVVQQPIQTRVTRRDRPKRRRASCMTHSARLTGSCSVRFNLEPTPIVRLQYHSSTEVGSQDSVLPRRGGGYRLNPRLFLLASLFEISYPEMEETPVKDQRLLGSTISSSHALRNDDQCEHAGVDLEGEVCSRFPLDVC